VAVGADGGGGSPEESLVSSPFVMDVVAGAALYLAVKELERGGLGVGVAVGAGDASLVGRDADGMVIGEVGPEGGVTRKEILSAVGHNGYCAVVTAHAKDAFGILGQNATGFGSIHGAAVVDDEGGIGDFVIPEGGHTASTMDQVAHTAAVFPLEGVAVSLSAVKVVGRASYALALLIAGRVEEILVSAIGGFGKNEEGEKKVSPTLSLGHALARKKFGDRKIKQTAPLCV
jgi:predicted thioesterase